MKKYAIAVILFFSMHIATYADTTQKDVKEFVTVLSDNVLSALKNHSSSLETRQKAFEDIFAEYGDVPKIARFVSGKAWRQATDAERNEYVDVYKKYMAFTYAARITSYNNQTIKVGRVVQNNKRGYLVHSKIVMPTAEAPISLIWQLSNKNDTLKVVDLNIENISMSMTQRSEFEPILAKNNFSLAKLTATLQNRVNNSATADKGSI